MYTAIPLSTAQVVQTNIDNLALLRFASRAPSKQEMLVYATGGLVTDEGIASYKNLQFMEVKSCR